MTEANLQGGVRSLLQTGLARSVGSLYLVQFVSYMLPLITLPWLARVLGPSGLGILALTQGFGSCVTLVVEYGFSFSATRKASIYRDSPERLSRLVAGVQGGKAVLAVGATTAALTVLFFIPAAHGNLAVLVLGVLGAVGQGFAMTWYFLGVERMPGVSATESALRVAASAGILLMTRSPQDLWKVVALQGGAAWCAAIAGAWLATRQAPFRWPTMALIREALTNGRPAIFFRVAETSYTSCNSLLLGFFCSPAVVGLYAGAEKIARGFLVSVLDPLQRSVYPGVAKALSASHAGAARLARGSATVTVSIAAIGSAAIFAAAPQVIRWLLGPGYEASAPALRFLLLVPVAVAFKWAIGLNWMVPAGHTRAFNTVIAGSSALHLAATFILAARWGQTGMAAAVALTEIFIPICIYLYLRRLNLDPFRPAKMTQLEACQELEHDSETEVHCH